MPEIPNNDPLGRIDEPFRIRGSVDNVPIPSQETLNFVLEQDTLKFKNLALHVVTELVVADILAKAVAAVDRNKEPANRLDIDRDTVLEFAIVHHAPRPLAEAGVAGDAGESVNEYMKTHDMTELAGLLAAERNFPDKLLETIDEINPKLGFPERTIGPENPKDMGKIDWTAAMTQLSSWLVANRAINANSFEKRFDDLIARHVDKPNVHKFTKDEWIGMKNWGEDRLKDLCQHLGIERPDLNNWMKSKINPTDASGSESDELIREIFKREPEEGEFLPISSAYKYLARSISSIGEPKTVEENGETKIIPNPQRRTVERLLAKPERFLHLCQQYGLLKVDDNGDIKSV